jgi:hypothetical protein
LPKFLDLLPGAQVKAQLDEQEAREVFHEVEFHVRIPGSQLPDIFAGEGMEHYTIAVRPFQRGVECRTAPFRLAYRTSVVSQLAVLHNSSSPRQMKHRERPAGGLLADLAPAHSIWEGLPGRISANVRYLVAHNA